LFGKGGTKADYAKDIDTLVANEIIAFKARKINKLKVERDIVTEGLTHSGSFQAGMDFAIKTLSIDEYGGGKMYLGMQE